MIGVDRARLHPGDPVVVIGLGPIGLLTVATLHARGIGPIGAAFGEAAVVIEQRHGEIFPDRCPQCGARREDGIGIDVVTDLAPAGLLPRSES